MVNKATDPGYVPNPKKQEAGKKGGLEKARKMRESGTPSNPASDAESLSSTKKRKGFSDEPMASIEPSGKRECYFKNTLTV